MDRLDQLENRSLYIIREAASRFSRPALLWSMGKDSTAMLWLARKAFFGRLPFPVLHIDTTFKFERIYEFRDALTQAWNLDLVVARNDEALARGVCCRSTDKMECCTQLKTDALRQAIAKFGFDALLVGIRRDEHGIRAKERHFSPRDESFRWNYLDQPPEPWEAFKTAAETGTHVRVHPLLDWTEKDVWQYVRREGMPVIDLYFSRFGKRFRSIGCEPCCEPIDSGATTLDEIIEELAITDVAERAGRAQDKERAHTMQNLRALGYL
ncbi:MAG: Sulfate adenylyltransferase subunit 2 [Phycisphaerae bacterium]|nr:Sulfate adenylyltransferase subunit 2 [Phycisphaerae bacterium]